MQFGREIHDLGHNLSRLDAVFEQVRADRGLGHPNTLPSERGSYPVLHQPTPNTATFPDITGDFHATLQECQSFLNDNSRFNRDNAGFVSNVHWWMRCREKDVKGLRDRVRAHSVKVRYGSCDHGVYLLRRQGSLGDSAIEAVSVPQPADA